MGLGVGSILSSLVALEMEISPQSRRGSWVTLVSSLQTFDQNFVALVSLEQLGILELGHFVRIRS